jgi:cell division protease FtsH
MRDFEDAKDKVLMGAERKSMAMSEEEKRNTAYHEGGHAIVALKMPQADPVHKATIIPRGRALGMVMQLPEGDRYSQNYVQMTSRLAIMMAGRVAEEIIFGKDNVTSGASSDIQAATRLAKAMVTRWGFSDKLGPLAYSEDQEEVFLGHSVSRAKHISDDTQRIIDEEVRRLIDEGYQRADGILRGNMSILHAMAEALLKYETLDSTQIDDVMAGPKAPQDWEDTGAPSGGSGAVKPEPVIGPPASQT